MFKPPVALSVIPLVHCCPARRAVSGGVSVIPKPAPCSFGLKEAQVQIKACKIKGKSGTFGHIPQVLLSQDVCMSHCLEIQVARCPPDTAALELLTPAGRVRGRGLLFSPEVAGR